MQVYGLQWDSTTALPFVQGAITAKYINGSFAQRPVHFGRGVVWIDVLGTEPLDAHWLDIETGDAKPEDFPAWNHEKHQRIGQWGGAYCNRATLPKVLEAIGTSMPADLWLATLDGSIWPDELAALPKNVTLRVVQAFPAGLTGFHADASAVVDRDYWEARHA